MSYDISPEFNWMQVMGKSKFFWFIPHIEGVGGPNGDGVVFPHKNGSDITELDDYYPESERDSGKCAFLFCFML